MSNCTVSLGYQLPLFNLEYSMKKIPQNLNFISIYSEKYKMKRASFT